jgi:hypothetical protein
MQENNGSLETSHQPKIVGTYLTKPRYDAKPRLPPKTKNESSARRWGEQMWVPWWNSLQPPSRLPQDGPWRSLTPPDDFSEWQTVCQGGVFGFSVLLCGLAWWRGILVTPADKKIYRTAVLEVTWVLEQLEAGCKKGSINWLLVEENASRPLTDAIDPEAGGRPGRGAKRGPDALIAARMPKRCVNSLLLFDFH